MPCLVKAIGTALQGVSWQRCRVHFIRNALAKGSKGHQAFSHIDLVGAAWALSPAGRRPSAAEV